MEWLVLGRGPGLACGKALFETETVLCKAASGNLFEKPQDYGNLCWQQKGAAVFRPNEQKMEDCLTSGGMQGQLGNTVSRGPAGCQPTWANSDQ